MRGSCPSRKLPCPRSSLISETLFHQEAQLLRPEVSDRSFRSYKGLTKGDKHCEWCSHRTFLSAPEGVDKWRQRRLSSAQPAQDARCSRRKFSDAVSQGSIVMYPRPWTQRVTQSAAACLRV